MSDEYYVKLTGNLLEGRSPDIPAQFLSDTFHVPLETGRTYFKGEPTTLKKKLDRETAEKVCQRLRNAGAECEIEEVPDLGFTLELIDDTAQPAAPAAQPALPETPEVALDDDDFSLELVDTAPEPASLEPIEQPEEVIAQPLADDLNELSLDVPAEAEAFDLEAVAVAESEPAGMELDGGWLYWVSTAGGVFRAQLSDGSTETLLAGEGFNNIAVGDGRVFMSRYSGDGLIATVPATVRTSRLTTSVAIVIRSGTRRAAEGSVMTGRPRTASHGEAPSR